MKILASYNACVVNNNVHKDNLILFNESNGKQTTFDVLLLKSKRQTGNKSLLLMVEDTNGDCKSYNVVSELEVRNLMRSFNVDYCKICVFKKEKGDE